MKGINAKHTLLALSILALSSCGNEQPTNEQPTETATETIAAPITTLADLNWLAGRWEHNMGEGIAFEEWAIADGGSLTGMGGFIKGTDTMISETIVLEQKDNDILYIPTVKDQNDGQPIPFKLTIAAGDSFVFENPAHDFPTMITYKKVSPTSLVASISGKINGEPHSETFALDKVR